MNVTPFILLRSRTLQQLVACADTALAGWRAAWWAEAIAWPDNSLRCRPAAECADTFSAAKDWTPLPLAAGASAWVSASRGLLRLWERQLFGLESLDATSEKHLNSALASGATEDALADLLARVLTEICGSAPQVQGFPSQQREALPTALGRTGSGAAVLTLRFADQSLTLVLPAAALRRQLLQAPASDSNALPRCASLQRAMGKITVPLSVELGSTDISIGELHGLGVGDVLRLPAALSEPSRLLGPGGLPLCDAYLGALDGHRAVECVTCVNRAE